MQHPRWSAFGCCSSPRSASDVTKVTNNKQKQPPDVPKRHWHRCFSVTFAKFLRTSFLQKTSGGCLIKKETDLKLA